MRPLVSTGARYMLASALCFSLMGVMVKLAGERLPSQEIVLARSLVSLVLSYGLLVRAGVSPWGNRRGLLLLRGLFGFIGLSCFFESVARLPFAEAVVIQYTSPIWTALLAALLLREGLGRLVLVSSLASLAGVVAVMRPDALLSGTAELEPLALVIAVCGAVFAAAAYVVVRRLGSAEHPLVVVFYFPLVAVPATLPAVVADFVMPTGIEFLLLLGIGVTTQIAQVYLTRGLALETAGKATAISYVQVVLAVIWGLVFFDEIPDEWTFVGAALILLGTAALAVRRRRRPRPA